MKTPLSNQYLQPPRILPTRCRGFSLVELALVLFLVSLLTGLALPRYSAQQQQGRSTAMQLELMACVQTLHGLQLQADPSETSPWLMLADGDGDGLGDQFAGSWDHAGLPGSGFRQRSELCAGSRGSSDGGSLGHRSSGPPGVAPR